jgi:ketosteroid isomerase-like protein
VRVIAAVDVDAVLAANRRFYEAFEARDLDAMSDLWEHSDRATCTHPGWSTLRGWAGISASFFALFQGDQQLQFILTQEHAAVDGDLAWVTVDENILGASAGGTAAALNLFTRDGGQWRMVVHHASAIAASAGSDEEG